jgi:RNA polymerase-binding transcription factor DksA
VDEHDEHDEHDELQTQGSPDGPSERERELAVIARAQSDLADVDLALQRLDEGTYGTCEVCSEPIPDDVLERAPAGRLCAAHGAPAGS